MGNEFRIILLRDIETFISGMSLDYQDKISGAVEALKNKKFDLVYIKQLKGDIKELKVKKYRLIFFIHKETVYFVRILMKKTNKTPRSEIDLAEKYYKLITN